MALVLPGNSGEERIFHLRVGQEWKREDLVRRFIDLLYERNEIEFSLGYFRMKGDTVEEIYPGYSETALRLEFFGPGAGGMLFETGEW